MTVNSRLNWKNEYNISGRTLFVSKRKTIITEFHISYTR